MNDTQTKTKLLFIVSNDFGELSYVLHFITGQPFEVLIAMPEILYKNQSKSLPYPTRCYESFDDLQIIIEAEQAQIVFLYCGYLYVIHNLLSFPDLEKLLNNIKSQKIPIVTSDPFLGLILEINEQTFSNQHPHKKTLTQHFSMLSPILEELPHIYPVHVEGEVGKRYSFFNEHIIGEVPTLKDLEKYNSQDLSLSADKKRWLFILSSEDYALQINQLGKQQFEADIIKKIHETVAQGRQPILIAPQPCLDSLNSLNIKTEGFITVPFCNIMLFQHLLLEAEVVFYWNILSNSILMRVFNNLPIFFFAPGHTITVIPKLYELGLTWYYSDIRPPFVDPQEKLDLNFLLEQAEKQEPITKKMRENFYKLPSPVDFVQELLGRQKS